MTQQPDDRADQWPENVRLAALEQQRTEFWLTCQAWIADKYSACIHGVLIVEPCSTCDQDCPSGFCVEAGRRD